MTLLPRYHDGGDDDEDDDVQPWWVTLTVAYPRLSLVVFLLALIVVALCLTLIVAWSQ